MTTEHGVRDTRRARGHAASTGQYAAPASPAVRRTSRGESPRHREQPAAAASGPSTSSIERLVQALVERAPDLDERALDDEHLRATVDMIANVLPRHSPWDDALGPFYTTTSLRKALGITRQAIDSRCQNGSLIRVRTVDGGYLYPSFQIQDGVPIRGLRRVVQVLRQGTDDDYTIAQWLATPTQDRPSPADRLRAGDDDAVLREARHAAGAWAS